MRRTIIIAGAGPAGLSLARGLAQSRHQVILIEPQSQDALADPAADGREIALTLRSCAILRDMDVWQTIPPDEAYPLRQARVRNGGSPFALSIGSERGDALGQLVSNHLIRRALFQSVSAQPNVSFRCGRKLANVIRSATGVTVELDNGEVLTGDLLVAADSRFSHTRSQLGIEAKVERFGHTMLVARIAHEAPHHGAALEWFDNGRTIALLPLAEGVSSLVLTLPDDQARRLCAMDDARIENAFADYLRGELGAIGLMTRPHAYPLAMTFSRRFAATRAVLIGDTAVGMHPVTAHGFNFGLLGANRLAKALAQAEDPGAALLLRRWALRHRLATLPLYQATLQLVRLYTDDRRAAAPLRSTVLRIGAFPPISRMMGRLLSEGAAA